MRPSSSNALQQRGRHANAPRQQVRRAEPRPLAVEHSGDRIANASHKREPFSLFEFAAGSSAVAAVVLIAFVGVRVTQPAHPPADNSPSAAAAPTASAEATQPRRHVPTATARARQGLPPSGVTASAADSPGDHAAARIARPANMAATTGGPASIFFAEAAPTTAVEMQSADTRDAPLFISPIDLFQTKDAITASPRRSVRVEAIPPPPEPTEDAITASPERSVRVGAIPPPPEPTEDAITASPERSVRVGAIPPSPEPERNPSNRSDALWIQTKLHELGYLAGNASGIWGPASRYALRDFKTMNGLAEDEKWDPETEHRLLSKQNVPASSTFIGGWAQSVEVCQHFRGAGAPLVIRSRGAETDNVKCNFKSVKRELATTWHVQATCSSGGQSWNATVSLKLTGSSLNWSSEKGKETYLRCVRP